jgi:hypothetical protein
MPDIAGQVVILTVSDVERRTDWYCRLLGMEETSRYVQPDGHAAWRTWPSRAVGQSCAWSPTVPVGAVSMSSGSGWITRSSLLLSVVISTPGLRGWTNLGYATPASRNRLTPPTPCRHSAIPTTFSWSSSGGGCLTSSAYLRSPVVSTTSTSGPRVRAVGSVHAGQDGERAVLPRAGRLVLLLLILADALRLGGPDDPGRPRLRGVGARDL